MLVTHTTNAEGHQRVYLGCKSSVECWIEPVPDGPSWTFHLEDAPTCYPRPPDELRAWATHILLNLARMLVVEADKLATVPFERIAALHTPDPMHYRRMATPKKNRAEHGYMASAPNITRPQADFTAQDFAHAHYRRR